MHATLHHARALVAADPVTVTVGAGAVQKEKGYPSPEYMEQGKLWVPGRPYPFDPTGPSGAGPRRPKRPTSYSWGGSRHRRPGPAAEPGASAPPGAGGLRGPSCHSLHPPATSQGTKEGGSHDLTPPRAASYHTRILQSSRVGRPEKPVTLRRRDSRERKHVIPDSASLPGGNWFTRWGAAVRRYAVSQRQ